MTMRLMAMAAISAGQDSAPTRSSGPWVSKYENQMCVLSRAYGTDPAKLQFALHPIPGDEMIEIVLIIPNSAKPFSRVSRGTVTLLPSGQTVEAYYRDYSFARDAKRMVRFYVNRDAISDINTATSLRIGLNDETRHLALTRTADAMTAIAECEDEMLSGWGMDPEVMRNIATPARPLSPENSWVKGDDYPAHALTRSQSGAVRLRWTVDLRGRVVDCAVVQSSGSAALDQTSCERITERGRYTPAIDRQGNPAPSLRTKTIQWSIFRPSLKQLNGN